MKKKCIYYLYFSFFLLIITSFIFYFFPSIDVVVSSFFYDPIQQNFPARHNIYWKTLRYIGQLVSFIIICYSLLCLFVQFKYTIKKPKALFLLLSFLLSNGVIVNLILKEFWGRARPNQLEIFGNYADYTPVWIISNQCISNCSFVSGEASSAIWMIALAFVFNKKYAYKIVPITLLWGGIMGTVRIAMGGHFLSDTIIAMLITIIAIIFSFHLLFNYRAFLYYHHNNYFLSLK